MLRQTNLESRAGVLPAIVIIPILAGGCGSTAPGGHGTAPAAGPSTGGVVAAAPTESEAGPADAAGSAQSAAPRPAPEPMPQDAALETIRELPATPRLSPAASVTQTVGITEMRITYSSPAVRERTIWGELVPYGELWRTGANAPTRIRFEHEVTFSGTDVPAGEYSVFTIPGESKWTVILNTDPDRQGAYEYDEGKDVARVEVEPEQAPDRERLTFLFLDTTETGTRVALEWAGTRVAVPVEVDTDAVIDAQTKRTLEAAWHVPYNIGRYHLEQEDPAEAATWLRRSVELGESWRNHWFLAQALKAQDEQAEARDHIRRALELGKGDRIFERVFKPRAEEALEQ